MHTDKLVSEFPYMAGVGLTLWWLDRLRHEQPLDAASRGQLVTLGLMAMCVFNVRREGLALIAAIAVAQLLDLRFVTIHQHSAGEKRRTAGNIGLRRAKQGGMGDQAAVIRPLRLAQKMGHDKADKTDAA